VKSEGGSARVAAATSLVEGLGGKIEALEAPDQMADALLEFFSTVDAT
jgi:hypothetical protein